MATTRWGLQLTTPEQPPLPTYGEDRPAGRRRWVTGHRGRATAEDSIATPSVSGTAPAPARRRRRRAVGVGVVLVVAAGVVTAASTRSEPGRSPPGDRTCAWSPAADFLAADATLTRTVRMSGRQVEVLYRLACSDGVTRWYWLPKATIRG